jgi:hypothetical protein
MISPRKPPSNVIPCKNWHITYLCEQMRPDEREQYVALSFAAAYDPEIAAANLINLQGPRFAVLGADGMPVCAGGFHEIQPGIWQSWMVGTMDGWSTHWRSMTKAARWLMQALFDNGARRLQTNALSSRTAACLWYTRSLNLKFEGVLRQYGRNGEDVSCFGRVRGD